MPLGPFVVSVTGVDASVLMRWRLLIKRDSPPVIGLASDPDWQ